MAIYNPCVLKCRPYGTQMAARLRATKMSSLRDYRFL